MTLEMEYYPEYYETAKLDMFDVLDRCTWDEIEEVKSALEEGRVDGEHYFSTYSQCGCLIGTIKKYRNSTFAQQDQAKIRLSDKFDGLPPRQASVRSPIEQLFLGIRPGTRDDERVRLVLEWISEYKSRRLSTVSGMMIIRSVG